MSNFKRHILEQHFGIKRKISQKSDYEEAQEKENEKSNDFEETEELRNPVQMSSDDEEFLEQRENKDELESESDEHKPEVCSRCLKKTLGN